jgi:hypothetical protein
MPDDHSKLGRYGRWRPTRVSALRKQRWTTPLAPADVAINHLFPHARTKRTGCFPSGLTTDRTNWVVRRQSFP